MHIRQESSIDPPATQPRTKLRIADCRVVGENGVIARADRGHDQLHRLEMEHTLTAGIAHDFKNVFQIIQSYVTILQSLGSSDKLFQTASAEILAASERGSLLANRFLALTRRFEMQKRVQDLNGFLSERETTIRSALRGAVELSIRCAQEQLLCEIDTCLIEQVLLNLCINARDAMPRGGLLQVSVDAATVSHERQMELTPGEYVRLIVADNGTGISPELLDRIFNPFFTTKPLDSGTGLGLALVRAIVSEHQGVVEVQTEVGVGSTFFVYLPRIQS